MKLLIPSLAVLLAGCADGVFRDPVEFERPKPLITLDRPLSGGEIVALHAHLETNQHRLLRIDRDAPIGWSEVGMERLGADGKTLYIVIFRRDRTFRYAGRPQADRKGAWHGKLTTESAWHLNHATLVTPIQAYKPVRGPTPGPRTFVDYLYFQDLAKRQVVVAMPDGIANSSLRHIQGILGTILASNVWIHDEQ